MNTFKILLCCATAMLLAVSCVNRSGKNTAAVPADTAEETETYLTAVDKYLTETVAKGYSPGEITIAYHSYIDVDESNPKDIQVWGDFWVENFHVAGDTLVSVSGGSHPGKMHVKKDSAGHFFVPSMDTVGDGNDFLPTAKEIFGERFDAFQKANSDNIKRDKIRKNVIAEYVRKNQLPVKVIKDYGWPAVEIPKQEN